MTHYLIEVKGLGTLVSEFPHSPEDDNQSQMDYLEDKLANGYEFVFRDGTSSAWTFMFRVVGK